MKPRRKQKTFKEEEQEWYARLKASGFEDIENTSKPDRPLKDWHSTKFMSERSRIRQAEREEYDRMIENFLASSEINEICSIIVKHGRNTIGPKRAKNILELHVLGLPERKIAKRPRR